jgi:hypothetical protein
MVFRSTILQNGKTATGIPVPEDVIEKLGQGRRIPVCVTVNDHTYRSSIVSIGGGFMISISEENRKKAGVKAGDKVDVNIEIDTKPRDVMIPKDLTESLEKDNDAKNFFQGLSFSHKRWYLTWIETAKKDGTRSDRITQAVKMLREGRKQG